eukprot:evm.model.scf_929.4 EVM.evm.TU.scf_929.4   scf_929:22241-24434(+)
MAAPFPVKLKSHLQRHPKHRTGVPSKTHINDLEAETSLAKARLQELRAAMVGESIKRSDIMSRVATGAIWRHGNSARSKPPARLPPIGGRLRQNSKRDGRKNMGLGCLHAGADASIGGTSGRCDTDGADSSRSHSQRQGRPPSRIPPLDAHPSEPLRGENEMAIGCDLGEEAHVVLEGRGWAGGRR